MRLRSIVFLTFLSFLWILIPRAVSAQEITPTPEEFTPAAATELPVAVTPATGGFSSPVDGATLSGLVEIKGTALSSWDLSFSYSDDSSGTWFALAQSADPISDGIFATWDTTGITDGMYILRLHVSAADGPQDFKINVRVQNYSQAESPTPLVTATIVSSPAPTLVSAAVEASATPSYTPAPSPTAPAPLPPNPATLDSRDIAVTFGKGVLGIALVFISAGLLLFLGRKLHS